MRLLSLTILLSAALAFSTTSFAQKATSTPADFSGTWQAVATKSETGEGFYDRYGHPVNQHYFVEHTLTVTQQGNELKVTITYKDNTTSKRTYYTDGSGEVNPNIKNPKYEYASQSRIKDRKFIVEMMIREVNTKREYSHYKIEWKLSKDGNELTIDYIIPGDGLGDVPTSGPLPRSDTNKQNYKRIK